MYCPHCEAALPETNPFACPTCEAPLDREMTAVNHFALESLLAPEPARAAPRPPGLDLAVMPVEPAAAPLADLPPLADELEAAYAANDLDAVSLIRALREEHATPSLADPLQDAPKPIVSHSGRRRRTVLSLSLGAALVLMLVIALVAALQPAHPAPIARIASPTAPVGLAVPQAGPTTYQANLTLRTPGWPIIFAGCAFAVDGYHVRSGTLCQSPIAASANTDVVAIMHVPAAGTTAGVLFRQSAKGDAYLFAVDGSGHWSFARVSKGTIAFVIPPTHDGTIQTGATQANILRVIAVGPHFTFIVNGVVVGHATDTTLDAGGLALLAINGDAIFTQIVVAQPVVAGT